MGPLGLDPQEVQQVPTKMTQNPWNITGPLQNTDEKYVKIVVDFRKFQLNNSDKGFLYTIKNQMSLICSFLCDKIILMG